MATSTISLGTSAPIGNSSLTIVATSTGSILATLRGFVGQLANLFQIQDSSGSNLFSINSLGAALFSNNVSVGGALGVTGLTTLGNASSTLFSNVGKAYFGGTATSTFDGAGALTLASALGVGSGGTGATTFNQGWLFSMGDGNALSASTSPTVNYITATSTTATSTFAYGINLTGGCFAKNGVCIDQPSDLQYVTSYKSNDTFTNIGSATTTLTTVAITPTTATGDVMVRAGVTFTSSNATNQPVSIAIRQTSCTGAILQNTLFTIAANTGAELYNLQLTYIAVDPGTTSQTYAFCISTSAGDTDVSAWDMSAIVIDTGADVAEIYTTNDMSLEAGDVVSYDFTLKTGVKKSASANDQNVLGIVSTKPAMVIGGVDKEGVKAVPVALSGRVPVKVTTENGAINPSDHLTSSSIPGVAMKSNGIGPVIGQAMSAYGGEGVGMVVAFVKNFDLNGGSVLLGDITPKTSADGSDNGLSTLIANIQSETAHDPIAIISKKITDGKQFLTDFVAARVTAIRGYFDEVFAKKVHTEQICVKKSDGTDVCVNGDQLNSLLQKANGTPAVTEPILQPSISAEASADTPADATTGTATETATDTPPTAPEVTAPVVSEPTPTPVEPVVTSDSTGSPQAEPTPPAAEQPASPAPTEASQ